MNPRRIEATCVRFVQLEVQCAFRFPCTRLIQLLGEGRTKYSKARLGLLREWTVLVVVRPFPCLGLGADRSKNDPNPEKGAQGYRRV
jgi:hypothetical protein